jgi:hypothetical protein
MAKDKATPPRIRILRTVRGDWPIGHMYEVPPGIYTPEVNAYGAVSVRTADGILLGIKPGEFEWEGGTQ